MNSMSAKTLPRTKTKTQKCEHRFTSTLYSNLPYFSDVRAASGPPGDGQKGPSGRPWGTLWALLRRLLGAQNAMKNQDMFSSLFAPSFGRSRGVRHRLRYGFCESKSMSHESPQVGHRGAKVSSKWLLWEVQWDSKCL